MVLGWGIYTDAQIQELTFLFIAYCAAFFLLGFAVGKARSIKDWLIKHFGKAPE